MAQTSPDIRQSQTRVLQDQLDSTAVVQMDSVLASINNELTAPGRLIAQSTPTLVVTIGSGKVVNPNTSKNRVFPLLNNVAIPFTGGTITFPSTSGTITASPGNNATITIGVSQFVAVLIQLDTTGLINMTVGTPAASLGAVTIPGGSTSFLSLGYVIVQSNASSVIQPVTNAMLYQFEGGGGGGGSGSGGLGDDLASTQFRGDIADTFQESSALATSTINGSAAFTTASFSSSNNIYAISYDASKTGTSTGTAFTLSGTPAYTVAAGDVVVNLVSGEVKKIASISSQTAYTLESAFTANLAGVAVCVSQAVHTKDVYNLAVDTNGNTLASAFPGLTFSEIAVFYKDNSTVGSNKWAIDTAANVGFTASPDNASWTVNSKRVTNVTDIYQSVILPSAGSALYLRFFSEKTSGTGTVNLIMYKAYVQKLASSSSSTGILWSAYGFSNNVTTPVGCTIASPAGKTVITLTGSNTYAVGVNPTQTYGSIDVYVNGQLLPRFLAGSVPATEGYYTEVSGTVIQLDRDYSSQQIEIQILSRTQIVDASTTNTTQLSALQDMENSGFQGFVSQATLMSATSTAGTPVAGTFYSSILNRASIVDLSQDLKPRIGPERLNTQLVNVVLNEFGPNGELVQVPVNDLFNQIRFVGNWSNQVGTYGNYIQAGSSTDFIEVTFYGTGLNILNINSAGGKSALISTDGGSDSANVYPAGADVIGSRGYNPNVIVPAINGLTLGVHTVKIKNNTANNIQISGFEIVNDSSTSVKVPAGISFIGGKKLTSTALSSFLYTAPVTGTRGGRVLVYQQADGTIGQSFQAANGSQANLASADHVAANEEVARYHYWREFGAGRTDDFSLVIGASQGSKAFTLEDGTTSLLTTQAGVYTETLAPFDSINTFGIFTFVGTGLDLILGGGAGTPGDTIQVIIDGTNVGSLTTGTNKQQKIVSGLPYGSHIVKLNRTVSATGTITIKQFVVYQPKKPTLPVGAVEIGEYGVMATFVANTTAGHDTISTGTLRKILSQREASFIDGTGGTTSWAAGGPSLSTSSFVGGWSLFTDRLNAQMKYTFFGTGFDMRFRPDTNRSTSVSVQIDGLAATTANFPSLTSSVYGGVAFSAGVLNQNATAVTGAGFVLNGLPLGLHTLTINNNVASSLMMVEALDIITPVHSPKSSIYSDLQNSLPIGSCGISDNRKITPVKDALPSQKGWAQAVGIANNPTTTSSVFVPMPDMSCTVKTSGGRLRVTYVARLLNNTVGVELSTAIFVDGVQIGPPSDATEPVANYSVNMVGCQTIPVAPGTHKVDVYWQCPNGGTLNAASTARYLLVEEL